MSCIKAEAVKQIGKRDHSQEKAKSRPYLPLVPYPFPSRKPGSLRYRPNNNPWSNTFVILAGSGEKRNKKKRCPAVASRYDHGMFVLANALYVSELRAIIFFRTKWSGLSYITQHLHAEEWKTRCKSQLGTRTKTLAGKNGDDVDAL